MFGRRRDNGAPLDANGEFDRPQLCRGPVGRGSSRWTPTSGWQIRGPRQTADSRILRRAYNYDRGTDAVGDLDMGLIFTCYQQNPKRQFEAVQERLVGEPLVDYISPFGGGYFFALPGVQDDNDYLGRGLLT